MKHNPGFGKPLPRKLFKGNVNDHFVKIAKDSGFKPPWIALQSEIRNKIRNIISNKNSSIESELYNWIDEVNIIIKKI
ncbi:DnaJ family domain-containing protein [Peribacillus sp. SCS-155]|uniref:DnaJ family domain-containing protein n=1 Tax=Peribacillus sedimenti TaxID=3115297 RepID=UPI003906C667